MSTITHRPGRYIITLGACQRVVTYDILAGFEAKREAWQLALDIEAAMLTEVAQ